MLGDPQAVFGIVAKHGELVDTEANAKGYRTSNRFPDRLEHLDRQAQAIFQGAAIGVGAMIEEGRSKGAQQPVMGDLHLDAVEARPDQIAGTRGEAVDHRADVVVVDGLGAEVARRFRHLGRRPQDMRGMFERCVTAVSELAENLGAMGMDDVGDSAVGWNDLGIPGIDETPRHLARRMDRLALEDDEADTAPGAFLMIGGVSIGRHAIQIAERREMRLKHETVAQFHRADGEWREQEGKLVVASRSTVTSIGRYEKFSTCLVHGLALRK